MTKKNLNQNRNIFWSRAQAGSNDEKNGGRKSRKTVRTSPPNLKGLSYRGMCEHQLLVSIFRDDSTILTVLINGCASFVPFHELKILMKDD